MSAGEGRSGRSKSNCLYCRSTATPHPWPSQCPHTWKKGGKRRLGAQLCCAADLPFEKIWGDNKYSNDSSVPQHPQPKLTTGPDVECQQQTQRSELWGAEAASTAWLNGAGDFPSPPLPSRHSQSLLGKSGAQPASQAASEC